MSLKCIIVDDEKPARNILRRYIEKVPDLELMADFKDPLEASSRIIQGDIDLIFLDIQMPGMSGLEFIKTLPKQVHIVLTTAYREFAYEGFELDVIDYLLKPIEFHRFLKSVHKVRSLKGPASTAPDQTAQETIVIKSDKRLFRLHPNEIIYIEGMREYIAYHTENNGRLIVHETIKHLEETLPEPQFIRVHRSYIVNTSKIKLFKDNSLKLGDISIPVSATYKEALMKLFKD